MAQPAFWMVLGGGTPTYRHDNQTSAEKEAERLARQNPGTEFIVLESLKSVKVCNAFWEEHYRNPPF